MAIPYELFPFFLSSVSNYYSAALMTASQGRWIRVKGSVKTGLLPPCLAGKEAMELLEGDTGGIRYSIVAFSARVVESIVAFQL